MKRYDQLFIYLLVYQTNGCVVSQGRIQPFRMTVFQVHVSTFVIFLTGNNDYIIMLNMHKFDSTESISMYVNKL